MDDPPLDGNPADRWRQALEAHAIPDPILGAAPESPWGFSPEVFGRAAALAVADDASTPSKMRALESLPTGGSVLDVGAGGGAASLPLAPPAGLLVAVDESSDMLESFAKAAGDRCVEHVEILGPWPDVAPHAVEADVVVCHHVTYNVPDLAPFLIALDEHARARVVIEMTDRHPRTALNPLWRSIHGLDRPDGPTADDAVAVMGALGFDVHVERTERTSRWDASQRHARLASTRRALCVGPQHDAEISAFLDHEVRAGGDRRQLVTIWWDGPRGTRGHGGRG